MKSVSSDAHRVNFNSCISNENSSMWKILFETSIPNFSRDLDIKEHNVSNDADTMDNNNGQCINVCVERSYSGDHTIIHRTCEDGNTGTIFKVSKDTIKTNVSDKLSGTEQNSLQSNGKILHEILPHLHDVPLKSKSVTDHSTCYCSNSTNTHHNIMKETDFHQHRFPNCPNQPKDLCRNLCCEKIDLLKNTNKYLSYEFDEKQSNPAVNNYRISNNCTLNNIISMTNALRVKATDFPRDGDLRASAVSTLLETQASVSQPDTYNKRDMHCYDPINKNPGMKDFFTLSSNVTKNGMHKISCPPYSTQMKQLQLTEPPNRFQDQFSDIGTKTIQAIGDVVDGTFRNVTNKQSTPSKTHERKETDNDVLNLMINVSATPELINKTLKKSMRSSRNEAKLSNKNAETMDSNVIGKKTRRKRMPHSNALSNSLLCITNDSTKQKNSGTNKKQHKDGRLKRDEKNNITIKSFETGVLPVHRSNSITQMSRNILCKYMYVEKDNKCSYPITSHCVMNEENFNALTLNRNSSKLSNEAYQVMTENIINGPIPLSVIPTSCVQNSKISNEECTTNLDSATKAQLFLVYTGTGQLKTDASTTISSVQSVLVPFVLTMAQSTYTDDNFDSKREYIGNKLTKGNDFDDQINHNRYSMLSKLTMKNDDSMSNDENMIYDHFYIPYSLKHIPVQTTRSSKPTSNSSGGQSLLTSYNLSNTSTTFSNSTVKSVNYGCDTACNDNDHEPNYCQLLPADSEPLDLSKPLNRLTDCFAPTLNTLNTNQNSRNREQPFKTRSSHNIPLQDNAATFVENKSNTHIPDINNITKVTVPRCNLRISHLQSDTDSPNNLTALSNDSVHIRIDAQDSSIARPNISEVNASISVKMSMTNNECFNNTFVGHKQFSSSSNNCHNLFPENKYEKEHENETSIEHSMSDVYNKSKFSQSLPSFLDANKENWKCLLRKNIGRYDLCNKQPEKTEANTTSININVKSNISVNNLQCFPSRKQELLDFWHSNENSPLESDFSRKRAAKHDEAVNEKFDDIHTIENTDYSRQYDHLVCVHSSINPSNDTDPRRCISHSNNETVYEDKDKIRNKFQNVDNIDSKHSYRKKTKCMPTHGELINTFVCDKLEHTEASQFEKLSTILDISNTASSSPAISKIDQSKNRAKLLSFEKKSKSCSSAETQCDPSDFSSKEPNHVTTSVKTPCINDTRKRRRASYSTEDLTCRYCRKTFINIYRLKRHESSHEDVRPYKCDVCQKAFKQSGHRNEHKLTHNQTRRNFLCNVCGVVIRSRSTFR